MLVNIKALRNKFIGLSLILIFAMSCQAKPTDPNDQCISAGDFGGLAKSFVSTTVRADESSYVDSGVTLVAGNVIQIKSSGNVELCANRVVTSNVTLGNTILQSGEWYATGIRVPIGARFDILATGHWTDNGTRYEDGREILARFSESGGVIQGNTPEQTWMEWTNADIFSPTKQRDNLTQAGDLASLTPGPRTFELYNYVTDKNGFSFEPRDGNERSLAYFGYTESDYLSINTSTLTVQDMELWLAPKDLDFNNNTGNLNITVEYNQPCPGHDGQFLMAMISNATESLHEFADSDGGLYDGQAWGSGDLKFKIVDNASTQWVDVNGVSVAGQGDGDYSSASNKGEYEISISFPRANNAPLGTVINDMIDPIKLSLLGPINTTTGKRTGGLTWTLYDIFVGTTFFINFIRVIVLISVIFMGYMYVIGTTQMTQKDLMEHVFKMLIVLAVISPGSWTFFYDNFFTFFIEGTESLIHIMAAQLNAYIQPSGGDAPITTGGGSGEAEAFAFLNQTMQRFFSRETHLKIGALFFSSSSGFFFAIGIYGAIVVFLLALMKAVILYILSIIMVSLLLFVAPIFITFILFKTTKGMFDNWIKNLLSFSLQPILLFMVLSVFNIFIFAAFYKVLAVNVCWACLWRIDLPINEVINSSLGADVLYDFDSWCALDGYKLWGSGPGMEPDEELNNTPIPISSVFIFILFCSAMLKYIDWVSEVANAITSGRIGSSLGGATSSIVPEGAGFAKTSLLMVTGAVGGVLNVADAATGRVASDKYKTVKRKTLKMMGGRSSLNPFVNAKGGSDGMGGKNRWREDLMTSKEKRAAKFEQKKFRDMSLEEKESKFLDNKQNESDYKQQKSKIKKEEVYKKFRNAGRRVGIRHDKLEKNLSRNEKQEAFKKARYSTGVAPKEMTNKEYRDARRRHINENNTHTIKQRVLRKYETSKLKKFVKKHL